MRRQILRRSIVLDCAGHVLIPPGAIEIIELRLCWISTRRH
jgi:hypothetical protein